VRPTPKNKQTRKPNGNGATKTGRPPTPIIATTGEIATRAYQLFIERGGQHGRDMEDWLRAEQELGTTGR
jgi:hypothetical protein